MVEGLRSDGDARARRLEPADVLALYEAGELPDRWRTRVQVSYMRPLLAEGCEVTVVRRPPRRGDVVCLVANANALLWRRILRGAPGRLVVRADIAPEAELWTGPVLGSVLDGGLRQRAARHLPTFWSGGVWHGALALAQLRAMRATVSRRARTRHADVVVRSLTDDDLPLLTEFGRRVMGLTVDLGEPTPGTATFGAFSRAGELAGHTTLVHGRRPAWSCNTFVAPAWRGAGVARSLLRAALDHARALGIEEVEGSIRARNLASVRACRSVGFVRVQQPREPNNYPEYQTWSVRLT